MSRFGTVLRSLLLGAMTFLGAALALVWSGGDWTFWFAGLDRVQWTLLLAAIGVAAIVFALAALTVALRSSGVKTYSVVGGLVGAAAAALGILAIPFFWWAAVWSSSIEFVTIPLQNDRVLVASANSFLDTSITFYRRDGMILFPLGSGTINSPTGFDWNDVKVSDDGRLVTLTVGGDTQQLLVD